MPIKPITYTIANHQIKIGGVALPQLAKEFGTPLYVLDEATIRENCRKYTQTLKTYYPNYLVAYASKALSTVALLNLLADEDMGLDVVSGGELYTALKSRMPTDRILFHGNNKSMEELKMAVVNQVTVVVDNLQEVHRLIQLTQSLNQSVKVLIRLKPEIDAHTHDFIKTGQIDSKFGVDRMNLLSVVKTISESQFLKYQGLHAHIGSQIFDIKPFEELSHLLVKYAVKIQKELGLSTEILNMGGGVGIYYTAQDDPPDMALFAQKIAQKLLLDCKNFGLLPPKLIIEPGRSIIGRAGITLYTIGAVKEIPTIKSYIFVDGGMADNPRPIMYQAQYSFEIANKPTLPATERYSIAGKFCESGDILAKEVLLPTAEAGDILTVYATGAYNYAMSSNYNRFCRPAMVMVSNGCARLILKRESYDDIIRNDIWN